MKKLEKALNKAIEGAAGVVEKIAAEINEDEGWTTENLKDLEKAVSILVKLSDSCEKLGIASGDDPLKDFIALREKQKQNLQLKNKPVKLKKSVKKTVKKKAKKKVKK